MQVSSVKTASGVEVVCIEDGTTVFAPEVFASLDAQTRAARLAAAGLSEIQTAFNCYLLRHPDGAVDLVDAGCGPRFGPNAGHLVARLHDLGVASGDIRNLIFTHLHGDHCGGAIGADGAVFENARVFVHAADVAQFAGELGGEVLAAYAGRVTEIGADAELPGGLRVWHLPGHTAGHCGLWIGEEVALVADILHSFALQLPDPETCPVYDSDPAQAVATRRAALAHLADTGTVFSGSHGIGARFLRAVKDGDGFGVTPA